jgi:ATP-dependent helicase HrpA/adenine-specific DNA-methyltransferase
MPTRPLQLRAQAMRRQPTAGEKAVWAILKAPPFDALHFRRQVPFGHRYIADFASHSARLIVEIDGPSHDPLSDVERRRTAWFEGQGYRVVRLTNEQVREWRLVERTLMRELGLLA